MSKVTSKNRLQNLMGGVPLLKEIPKYLLAPGRGTVQPKKKLISV